MVNFKTYTNTVFTSLIHRMFINSFSKEWYETYWAIDLHGTVLKSNHKKGDDTIEYYPYAKETLQLLSKRDDIVLIIFSSSYPDEIKSYNEQFEKDGIKFKFINSNPDISSRKGNFGFYENKFYFNILFDDKAGFVPENEWKEIYKLLSKYETFEFLPNKEWTTKY